MKDLSHLPTARPEIDGNAPDVGPPLFGSVITEREAARPRKPHAKDTPFRYSDAGKCAHKLSLQVMGHEPDPIEPAGLHVMRIGTLVHEDWQAAMWERHGTKARFEVVSDVEMLTSGSCDAVMDEGWVCPVCLNDVYFTPGSDGEMVPDPDPTACPGCKGLGGRPIVVELKTKGGFGYKKAVGAQGPATGPSHDQIVQLALNTVGNDADAGVLVMMATDAISGGMAEKKGIDEELRYVAEWTYPRDQLQKIADKEIARLCRILEMADEGEAAPRMVPEVTPPGAVIEDPVASRWNIRDDEGGVVKTGQIWGGQHCKFYCNQFSNCIAGDAS